MQRKILPLASVVFAAMLINLVMVTGVAAHDGHHADHHRAKAALKAAYKATHKFRHIKTATRAGYALPDAPAPLHECIASFDDTGAMGFHYINGSLLDAKLDPRKPEVLVYAPDKHGKLRLVALEYVVFQADWIAAHGDKMPKLFGQMFMATGDNNRFQIPPFFSMHVWLYKHNPSGLFAPFNPRVSCDPKHDRHHDDPDGRRADADRPAIARLAAASFTCAIAKGSSART